MSLDEVEVIGYSAVESVDGWLLGESTEVSDYFSEFAITVA